MPEILVARPPWCAPPHDARTPRADRTSSRSQDTGLLRAWTVGQPLGVRFGDHDHRPTHPFCEVELRDAPRSPSAALVTRTEDPSRASADCGCDPTAFTVANDQAAMPPVGAARSFS